VRKERAAAQNADDQLDLQNIKKKEKTRKKNDKGGEQVRAEESAG